MSRKKIDFSENNLAFGLRLLKYRKSKKLTASKIAEKLSVSQGFLSDIEQGKTSFSQDKLISLLSIFDDLNPDWLLTGRGEMLKTCVVTLATLTDQNDQTVFEPDTDTRRLLLLAQKVLKHENKLVSGALAQNIDAFHYTVEGDHKILGLETENKELKKSKAGDCECPEIADGAG